MKSRKKRSFFRHPAFIAVVLLVVIFALLELTNTTHILHKDKSKVSSGNASGQYGTNNNPGPGTLNKTQQGITPQVPVQTKDSKQATTHVADLLQPTGNFVSAHKNVPSTTSLSSVCNTTSGATCQITFTNGSVVKSLSSQTTDSTGAAYWNSWKPSDLGLTSGSWQVQAVAILNGQTKTSTDAMNLEIQ